MVRSMMSYSSLPISFLGYALQTTIYILNLNGCKPNLHHIRIWRCLAHVLKGKTDKMESRSDVCFFVGYPKRTRGYCFYNPLDKKVFVSTNATFLEDKYIEEHKSTTKILLEETLEHGSNNSVPDFRIESNSDDLEPPTEPMVADEASEQVMPTGPHRQIEPEDQTVGREEGPLVRLDNQAPSTITRSGRVVRPPSRYLLYGESY
ncbi:uncharacterized protein LOC111401554 [Olea europaea var. sylvestris]|uniref:uncharacterized protein LOC111401554 n=1 Tax=Olea europaea var. sylvestris TaxID=158386 RepID=UPI000C1CCCEF|nr:uncharacterized protein LOC111401554 [Olea europaea var. sylvestris]